MPKRKIEVVITGNKIQEILVLHARGGDRATVSMQSIDLWAVHIPVFNDDGFMTTQIVEYEKREVDEILMQEARTRYKVDITGGGQKISYTFDSKLLISATIELQGKKK